MVTLNVSEGLLREIIYALEARLRDINSRGSEPTGSAIANTSAALEMARAAIRARG